MHHFLSVRQSKFRLENSSFLQNICLVVSRYDVAYLILVCDLDIKGPKGQGQIRVPNTDRWAHYKFNVKLLHLINFMLPTSRF